MAPRRPRGEPGEARPQTPQLALRVAVLGGVAVLLFAVLFFRLWVLQVLNVKEFQAQATENRERTVQIAAPRGLILDRKGRRLVTNRPSNAVTYDLTQDRALAEACGRRPYQAIDTRSEEIIQRRRNRAVERAIHALPKRLRQPRAKAIDTARDRPMVRVWAGCAEHSTVLKRLARLTDTPLSDFEDSIHLGLIRAPFEPVTLLTDAPRELVFFLKEHGSAFQGVRISNGSVRSYPQIELASHVFGDLAQISREQLADAQAFPGAESGDIVGQTGVERAYDRYLRGHDGELRLRVDAQGEPEGNVFVSQPTEPGDNLQLTLDSELQKSAESALAEAVARSQTSGADQALSSQGGAIVAIDAKTGAVLAMASYPNFNPNQLVGARSAEYRRKLGDRKGLGAAAPLFDRASSGLYPAGSTYKPLTAIAAMQSGVANPYEDIQCTPSLTVDGQPYRNFESQINEPMNLMTALEQSCDTYFYQLGKRLYDATPRDGSKEPQAYWGKLFGFGRPTGIDVGGESSGTLPDIAYKAERYPPDDLINRFWTSGDAVLTAIGQGDLQVTPLQIAAFYAALANGGTLVTPHLGDRILRPDGTTLVNLRSPARRKIGLDPNVLASIRAGLLAATHQEQGTADQVFSAFEPAVAGKTGTAEKAGKRDYAWFAGYAPADDPQIVVVALVEQGGFGGEIAAPAAGAVFASYFGVDAPPWPVRTAPETPPPATGSGGVHYILGDNGQISTTYGDTTTDTGATTTP